MEKIDSSDILKPGTKIKPEITQEQAKLILLRVYGITTVEICELNSYDDRNFLIYADKTIKNPNIKGFSSEGYIFKVLNAFDSLKIGFIEGQTELSLFLSDKKFVCPRQLKNLEGGYYSVEDTGNQKNVCRLYEFIPGKILCDVQPCPNLFYQAGIYAGKMDNALKNFHHEGYTSHKTLWMLESVPKLQDFVYVVNEGQRQMVEDIIIDFQKKVLDKFETFEKQMIHGDFNEQNILVGRNAANTANTVIGVLDFGDTQYSCLIFELAVGMTYMMATNGDIQTGGLFMAGYSMTRMVPEHEEKVLKLCICARLCQSLVLGLYTHALDKGNDYLLTTQKVGWKLLEDLWSQSDKDILALWHSTADEYLTQSYK